MSERIFNSFSNNNVSVIFSLIPEIFQEIDYMLAIRTLKTLRKNPEITMVTGLCEKVVIKIQFSYMPAIN
jgi:hypothetical protein